MTIRLFTFVSCLIIVCFFPFDGSHLSGQGHLDQIDSLSKQLRNPSEIKQQRVDLLNELSFAYRRVSADSIIMFADKAIEIATEINYKKGLMLAFKNRGIGKFKQGYDIESITKCYDKAAAIAEEIGDYYTMSACLNNQAIALRNDFSYSKALEKLYKALEIQNREFTKESKLKALITGNIGTVYKRLNNDSLAISFLSEALELSKKHGYLELIPIYSDAKALIKFSMDGDLASENIVKKAILDVQKIDDLQSVIQKKLDYAEALLSLSRYKAVDSLLNTAQHLAQDGKFNLEFCRVLRLRSEANYHLGHYEMADLYLNETADCHSYVQSVEEKKNLLELEYQILSKRNRLSENSDLVEEYVSILSQFSDRKVDDIVSEFNNRQTIEQQKLQLDFQQKKDDLKLYWLRFLTIALGLLLLTLLWAIHANFKSLKTSKLLQTQNEILQATEITLENKNKELNKYIESNIQLEQFAHIASHDLKSPIRGILSFSKLLKIKSKGSFDEKQNEYLDFIISSSKKMSNLVNDLLSFSIVNSQSLNITAFEFDKLMEVSMNNLEYEIKNNKAIINITSNSKVIQGDFIKLRQVFQNLISNSLKFVEKGKIPQIDIELKGVGDDWYITLTDNGIGIKEEFKDRIFQVYERLHSDKSYEGTGMGLSICKRVVEKHRGVISVDSEEGKGSTFTICIPKEQTIKKLVVV